MWSLGVIVYILLGGYPPFIEQNQRELFRKIRKGRYQFHVEYWAQISEDAKDLIRSLLVVKPNERFDADHALNSKWITDDANALKEHDLGDNLKKLQAFNAKRKMKAAIKAVMATQKLTSLGVNLKEILD